MSLHTPPKSPRAKSASNASFRPKNTSSFFQNPKFRKSLAILFFMGTLGLVIVQVARIMSKNPQETDDAKILLYNTTQCELVAVSPERVPGIDFPSASLTLFSKTKQHTPPRAGMTLETLEEAGLFPAWLYKVDPITHQGMYALPSQPDAWIGMNDPMFTAWMRKRMEEVYMRAGDRPVPLTLGQR